MQIKQLFEKNSTLEYYTFSYTWASATHYGIPEWVALFTYRNDFGNGLFLQYAALLILD